MSPAELARAFEVVWPHVVAVALCAARLLPVAFLCPLLGGAASPTTVRLGTTLALSIALHSAGGVELDGAAPDALELAALATRELVLGLVIGLVAGLPFDAARIAGRLADLFRGSSAEAALPLAGSREAASGDLLYQLLLALAVTGPAGSHVLHAVWLSFGAVRVGGVVTGEAPALQVAQLVGASLSTGLAVGAPLAAAALGVDLLAALVSRVGPQASLQELAGPAKLQGGAAILWLGTGVVCERLLQDVFAAPDALGRLLGGAR